MDDDPLNSNEGGKEEQESTQSIKVNDSAVIQENKTLPVVKWREEAMKGIFSPAAVLLYKKELKIDDVVDITNGNTLLHCVMKFGYIASIRCFIETFNANPNIRNNFGQTPLHLLCEAKSPSSILSVYLVGLKSIDLNALDNHGHTPLIYTIRSGFHFMFFNLIARDAKLDLKDNLGNGLLYHSLISSNRVALNFVLNHVDSNINGKFIDDDTKKSNSLAEILTSSPSSSIAKFLVTHYHSDISMNTIVDLSRKELKSFSKVNVLTYELFSMLGHVKLNKTFEFLKKVMFEYRFKLYLLYFFIWFKVKFLNENIKYTLALAFFLEKLFFIFLLPTLGYNLSTSTQIQAENSFTNLFFGTIFHFAIMFISVVGFYWGFNKLRSEEPKENFYLPIKELSNDDNVLKNLYEISSKNSIDTFFEEEICEICLIRKDRQDNHCHTCKRCVKNFYFHSNFFNRCINKKNVPHYISVFLAYTVTAAYVLWWYVWYLLRLYDGYRYSEYSSTNFIFLFRNTCLTNKLIILLNSLEVILCFQVAMVNLLCLGYNIGKYNLFKNHKKSLGGFEQRQSWRTKKVTMHVIPDGNKTTFKAFWSNIYQGFKYSY